MMNRERHLPLVDLSTLTFAAVSVLTLGGLMLLTACASSDRPRRLTPYDEALRQVYERRGEIGWDGLQVGMTFAEVERAVGRRLGSPEGPDPLCDRYSVEVALHDQPLRLAFTGGTQSARLASITLLLPNGFETDPVIDALETRLGILTFIPSPHVRDQDVNQARKPLFETPGENQVFINPEQGVSLGDVCVD
jgi:hypothetical protein